MAQSLDEQVNTIERALGERMIEHALVIVRAWLNELGENNLYEEAYSSIQTEYKKLFLNWLSSDDENTDEVLNRLTGEMYQLTDAVYADVRIQRGLSPDMHGFSPNSPQSVANYFQNCLKITKEDYAWLHNALIDSSQASIGVLAIGALAKNVRECFSLDAINAMIDGAKSAKQIVADQCMANLFLVLIQYDIRIDFFPQLQEAVLQLIGESDEEQLHAFMVLCAIIEASSSMPSDEEHEFMDSLLSILTETWLYDLLVVGHGQRESTLAHILLDQGRMDMMWEHLEDAEKHLVTSLRKGSKSPLDYINYGHCLLLKGDRIMAFETYKQARQLCSGPKEFFAIFRPDRRALVDHGVPVEQVYLIEDQLLKSDA